MGCLFTFFNWCLRHRSFQFQCTISLLLIWFVLQTSLKSNSLLSFKDIDIRLCYNPCNHLDQSPGRPLLLPSLVFFNTVFFHQHVQDLPRPPGVSSPTILGHKLHGPPQVTSRDSLPSHELCSSSSHFGILFKNVYVTATNTVSQAPLLPGAFLPTDPVTPPAVESTRSAPLSAEKPHAPSSAAPRAKETEGEMARTFWEKRIFFLFCRKQSGRDYLIPERCSGKAVHKTSRAFPTPREA